MLHELIALLPKSIIQRGTTRNPIVPVSSSVPDSTPTGQVGAGVDQGTGRVVSVDWLSAGQFAHRGMGCFQRLPEIVIGMLGRYEHGFKLTARQVDAAIEHTVEPC